MFGRRDSVVVIRLHGSVFVTYLRDVLFAMCWGYSDVEFLPQ